MNTREIDPIAPEILLNWPRPSLLQVPNHIRKSYIARHRALAAYMSGSSLSGAAKRYGVNRNSLLRQARLSVELDPGGKPWGFRVCIPYFRVDQSPPADTPAAMPTAAAPHAFGQMLRSRPALRALIDDFIGNLPAGRNRSHAFDRLFKEFKQQLKDSEHLYPLNTQDKGRRALLEYLRRQRRQTTLAAFETSPPKPPAIERLDQLFALTPFMRTEYDGHFVDVDLGIEVPTPDGGWATRDISGLIFLVAIDAVSRVIVSWSLVLGRGYRQFDLMEMLAKGMVPWAPGIRTTPELCYVSGAGMPSSAMPDGKAPRSILTAGDNYRAHQSHHALHNLLHVHRGVWNWSQAHIPEKRPIVEAFFHHIEAGALRSIAGGYLPSGGRGGKKIPTNELNPGRHPVNVLALLELMEVIVTAYQADGHQGLHDRSPLAVLTDYVDRGGWIWQSSLSERHAEKMSLLDIQVTLRGSREHSRQPYVDWKGARYRSDALINRFDLVNKSFRATIPFDDLRVMTLLDTKGNVFVRLLALPPWHASKHDVRLREQIIKWNRAKVMSIKGVSDAVLAYHHYVRTSAHRSSKSTDLFARNQAFYESKVMTAPQSSRDEAEAKIPREGWIGAEGMEDLP